MRCQCALGIHPSSKEPTTACQLQYGERMRRLKEYMFLFSTQTKHVNCFDVCIAQPNVPCGSFSCTFSVTNALGRSIMQALPFGHKECLGRLGIFPGAAPKAWCEHVIGYN